MNGYPSRAIVIQLAAQFQQLSPHVRRPVLIRISEVSVALRVELVWAAPAAAFALAFSLGVALPAARAGRRLQRRP